MHRQRQEVRGGGAHYSTELAGRDRFLFFRRPVEPSGGELPVGDTPATPGGADKDHAGTWHSGQVRYAASTPAAPALGHGRSIHSTGAGAGAVAVPLRGQRRPSSVEADSRRRRGVGGRNTRAKGHHLPSLSRRGGAPLASTMPASSSAGLRGRGVREEEEEGAAYASATGRDCGVQTTYRENDAQTDPYSPDYFIPDGAPEPEILKLQGLTYQNGALPAGREEVALIQRLRRRREVEESLPTGHDEASIEARYRRLHELEEEEWRDREAHMEHLHTRRLDRIKATLHEREAAREEANQERLETIKQQYLASLSGKLSTLQARSMGDRRRAMDRKIARNKAVGIDESGAEGDRAVSGGGDAGGAGRSQSRGARTDLIASYVKYGASAAPPVVSTDVPSGLVAGGATAMTYDVRPLLLTDVEGVEEVDHRRSGRIERMAPGALAVPENEAIARLPTLYQRHEAERLVHSLERAHHQIQAGKARATAAKDRDGAASPGGTLQQLVSEEVKAAKQRSVLDLYRAPPKVQRPPTPELELDGDAEEDSEEACILLQRLLRGRAVQNDFFEGKERCRGLIQELQAASDAKEAERAEAEAKELEALAQQQRDMVDDVVSAAVGDIIGDTLGFLYQELDRQRDVQSLQALRAEAESVRRAREATEAARREAERACRDREELHYAALVRATGHNATAFLERVTAQAVRDTALAAAVEVERTRQGSLPTPRDPDSTDEKGKEALVCDMLDGFVLPAVVDSIQLQEQKQSTEAPAGAARDVARNLLRGGAPPNA